MAPPVTGNTEMLGIVADPIHHVRTPQLINRLIAEREIDALMVPWHVGSRDLATFVAGLRAMRNLLGFVATVPHKPAMRALCDDVTPAAAQADAVNVVRRGVDGRLTGTMLDGAAFVAGLGGAGVALAGRSVYLAGAGGAASAIAFAVAGAGVDVLTIANRTVRKAQELAERVSAVYPRVRVTVGSGDPSGMDIVVNGTSLGMHRDDPLPLDVTRLLPRQIVAEIIMQPEVTPLLAAARRRGCRTHPGEPMLVAQVGLMADFMGVPPAR